MTSKSSPSTGVQSELKKVFVVSPIGAPGTDVHRRASYALKYIFREALKGDEWIVHRADEGKSPDSIGQHVIKWLFEADLIIADLSGHNPNVFYELAIAHGWRKPVVHLISKGEKVPFDIVDLRTIFYDITDLASVEEAVLRLREYAEYALAHTDELVNPLTSFEMFKQIRADPTEGGDAVADALEQVVTRLSSVESRLAERGQAVNWATAQEEVDLAVERYAALIRRLEVPRSPRDGYVNDKSLRQEMVEILKQYPPEQRQYVKDRARRMLDMQRPVNDSETLI